MIFHALGKNKNAYSNFFEITTCAIESTKLIKAHENKIDKMLAVERLYVNDIQELKKALEEEKETQVSLEKKLESFEELNNEITAKLTKERDHAIAMVNVLKKEKIEFGVVHAKLLESHDQLQIDRKSVV